MKTRVVFRPVISLYMIPYNVPLADAVVHNKP